jgi:hypothetical protein
MEDVCRRGVDHASQKLPVDLLSTSIPAGICGYLNPGIGGP